MLAVWQNCAILIRTPDGSLSRVDLAKGAPPSFDDPIEVVGFPETDFYRVNFARAIWRPTNLPERPPDVPRDISADSLMTDIDGKKTFNADFHGKTVRLRGTVRSLPRLGLGDGRLLVESANAILPVEIGADPTCTESLAPGSVVDVTGVCVTDLENGRPNLVFPHIKEVLLVVRKPGDIAIVRNPPWWTPTKFLVLIGSLVLAIAAILAWNRSLRTLARRRGKALADEELGRLASDLKVIERTRLAVELHDSVAQNLTGVSMEIDTALRGDEPLPTAAAQHMGRALRTIDSCRGELRNCLWDLRSQALEETDMNKAIRLTLSQTIGKADLAVRFNVPRSRFTDNTAHAILRIIRELAANAVRHGNATEIKIAEKAPNVRVLVLTTFSSSENIAKALKAGASGAILKSSDNDEMIAAVLKVAGGERFLSADIERLLADDPPLPDLSPRQVEILESIARGLSNKEISSQFDISLESVKSHIKIILEKLGAANRTEAASIAQRKRVLKS